jgi:hypothetical protein
VRGRLSPATAGVLGAAAEPVALPADDGAEAAVRGAASGFGARAGAAAGVACQRVSVAPYGDKYLFTTTAAG